MRAIGKVATTEREQNKQDVVLARHCPVKISDWIRLLLQAGPASTDFNPTRSLESIVSSKRPDRTRMRISSSSYAAGDFDADYGDPLAWREGNAILTPVKRLNELRSSEEGSCTRNWHGILSGLYFCLEGEV